MPDPERASDVVAFPSLTTIPQAHCLAEVEATLGELESLGQSLASTGRVTGACTLEATAARYRRLCVWSELRDASLPFALRSAEQMQQMLELQLAHAAAEQRLREVEYQVDRMRRSESSEAAASEASYHLRARSQRLLEALTRLRTMLRMSDWSDWADNGQI